MRNLALAVLSTLALASVAHANANDVRVNGTCTGRSAIKMKLSPQNGAIELELEVDQNRNGEEWQFRVLDQGSVVTRGRATTQAPSGSFDARRVIADLAGVDDILAQARNSRTGELCEVAASW